MPQNVFEAKISTEIHNHLSEDQIPKQVTSSFYTT